MREITQKIKEKKPLERLDESFVQEYIELVLNQNVKLKTKLQKNKLKEQDKRKIVKLVRNELNKRYGQFWAVHKQISLESHKSTKERMRIYKEIYDKILKFTGNPRTILDIGAGLNPMSYYLIGKDAYYYVNELTKEDCKLIKDYLTEKNFKFEIIQGDAIKLEFPDADVCFLFKILESLDKNGHKNSEELIKKLKCKYLVISFSNIDTKNRKMNYPRRGWIEQMLNRLNYEFNKIEFPEETFYLVKKLRLEK